MELQGNAEALLTCQRRQGIPSGCVPTDLGWIWGDPLSSARVGGRSGLQVQRAGETLPFSLEIWELPSSRLPSL